MNLGSYSENVKIQPVNTSISSWRQFEPICKFHQLRAFQNLMGGFYTEEPELKIQVYSHTADTNGKQDSLREGNLMDAHVSVNQDHPDWEGVSHSGCPTLNYIRETMLILEKSLARDTSANCALSSQQPQSFLYKESVSRDSENACYNENSFDPHGLRADDHTETPEVSSKEIQHSGENPELSVSQQEVTEEGVDSLASCWSLPGMCRSDEASWENCVIPDTEQSFANLDPLEEDLALDRDLQKVKHTSKQQEAHTQDLHLDSRVKEVQMPKVTKQQVFVEDINMLKKCIEELIENKYNVLLERNDINKKFQDSQDILANTQRHLQESRKEKETLQLHVKKIKIRYIRLQERYATEMRQKNRSVSQCLELEKTLSRKEEELESLQQLKGELEKTATSAQKLLEREKEIREQEFLSLQELFQKHEKENLRERRRLKSRVEKLMVLVKTVLLSCENEKAKTRALQQEVHALKTENEALQRQVACSAPSLEPPVKEPDSSQGIKMMHSSLFQPCSSLMKKAFPPAMKKTFPLVSKIHHLDNTSSAADHGRENERSGDEMLTMLRSFRLRKKDLHKEILKHKSRIGTLKELVTSEKAFRNHIIEVTAVGVDGAGHVPDVPMVLMTKMERYHGLNEELDFMITKLGSLLECKEDHCNKLVEQNDKYRRHVGSLINKVTSYEEIIKCADQRLEISHSQIAQLEERNKHLEDIIRMPREKARMPRPRLESHPKSMTLVISK